MSSAIASASDDAALTPGQRLYLPEYDLVPFREPTRGYLILAPQRTGGGYRKYSQRVLLNTSMLLLGVIFALGFLIGALDVNTIAIQAYVFVALVGAALGGYLILIYAMMGNVVDYDELLTNRRREAIYYGTFSFAIGLGTSVGTLILPLLLENFGYTQSNPLGVRLAFPVMAVFIFIGYFIFKKYRIGDTLEETRKNLKLGE